MEKEFVPYELAVKLKAIGFDEPCFGWFRSTRIPSNFTEYFLETEFGMSESPSDWVNSNFLDKACSAPLYQQAFRWFREKYGLRIRNYGSINYSGELSEYFEIFKYGYGTSDKSLSIEIGALTYEEAELDCLEKLIEIVEQKK